MHNKLIKSINKNNIFYKIKKNKTTSILFPGQGYQFVGMLNDLIPNNENIINSFDQNFSNIITNKLKTNPKYSSLLNTEKNYIFKFSNLLILKPNDNDQVNNLKRQILNETEFAQPAILLHSYLNYKKFIREKYNNNEQLYLEGKPFFLGPSLGEIISLVCSGSIPLEKASILLNKRGKYMQESCPENTGGMLNVVGDIRKNIKLFNNFLENKKNEYEKINLNLSSIMNNRLLVISGFANDIEKCKSFFKENSIPCRKLNVSAAFHSNLMYEGSLKFKEYLFNNNDNIFFDFPRNSIISTIEPDFDYFKELKGFYNNDLLRKELDFKVKNLLIKQFTEKVDLLESVRNYMKLNEIDLNDCENFNDIVLYDIIKRKNVDLKEYI